MQLCQAIEGYVQLNKKLRNGDIYELIQCLHLYVKK